MIVQDEGHIPVQCAECKGVSAVVVSWARDEKDRVPALGRSQWPKACPHCGMIAAMPFKDGELEESMALAQQADQAVRATMPRSR